MIITISSLPGSGKSTITKLVAKKLDYKHYSTGDFQRELAKEHGLTITQWGELEAKDKKYDMMVDKRTEQIAKTIDNAVFDSWLAPHFVPKHAIKIFLECDEQVRAKRRLPQKRETEQFSTIEEAIKDMRKRVECNRKRWIKYYNYDFLDMSNYDLVIDTTNLTPEQIVDKILKFVENVEKKKSKN